MKKKPPLLIFGAKPCLYQLFILRGILFHSVASFKQNTLTHRKSWWYGMPMEETPTQFEPISSEHIR